MCNLNSFSSFEQYSFPASFWKSSRKNAQPTILSSSPLWYFLQYHQRYSFQYATRATLASSPTTLSTLAHFQRHPHWLACHSRYHTQHITYFSMPPSFVNLPDSLPTKFITNLKIYMKRNFDTQQYKILYFKDDFFRHC